MSVIIAYMQSEFLFFLCWRGGREEIIYASARHSIYNSAEFEDRKEADMAEFSQGWFRPALLCRGIWFESKRSIYQEVLCQAPGGDFMEKPSTQQQGSNFLSDPHVQHMMNSASWART